MAGRGSRFASAGFDVPKPLIPVHGIPMIRWVIKNLTPRVDHKFVFVAQAQHVETYNFLEELHDWAPGASVIQLNGITTGAAATVLAAKSIIDNDEPLLIANSDQWVKADIGEFLAFLGDQDIDGSIMTMKATDPKWSYAEIGSTGQVTRVVEKEVISTDATTGIYGFKRGRDFVKFADQMISENFTVNGEHYVAPVYNWMIRVGKKISTYSIGSEANEMFGLGVPEDLRLFEENPISLGVWNK